MKKRYILHLVLLLALFASRQTGFAQVYTIGTGANTTTSTLDSPFGTFYMDDRTQILYTAADMAAGGATAGQIAALAFNVSSIGSPAMNGLTIKIGFTSETSLSSFSTASLTQVYQSTTAYTPASGWNTFTFSSPVVWNGSDNIVIDVCFDNAAWSSTSGVYADYFGSPKVYSCYQDNSGGTICGTTGGYCSSAYYRAQARFTIYPLYADDAGIGQVLSPSLPTCDLDSIDLTVVISNIGSDTLNSCNIHWQIGSGSVTTFNYTGTINPQGGLDTVTIGNTSFSNFDEITFWTTNPNGNTDSLTSNDTASMIVATGLSGTYAIPADYATIAAAAADLNAYGVCDDVIFNIASGTYTEQVNLGEVLGTGQNATITFQSASGNAADVTVNFTSNTQGDNWVIKLDGTDWVTLQDLTIQNNGTYIYTNVIDLLNGADHNTIQDCHIIGGAYGYTGIGNYMSNIYASGTNDDLKILNNVIEYGNCAIYSYATSADYSEGLLIQGNEIQDNYYRSLYIAYTEGVDLLENNIGATANLYLSPYGVYFYYCNDFDIKGNYIGSNYNNGFSYPLYLYYCNGENNPRSEVSNNCIHAGAETSTSYGYYGVYAYYSGIFDMNNNTIVRRGSSGYYGVYLSNGGLVRMHNNNIANLSGGYALYTPGIFTLTESDHNNFYSSSGSPIYWGSSVYASIEEFTEATGFDANSVMTDPAFLNELQCITCNAELDGNATPLATITADIQGNARSANTPDIGAVEYVNGANFNLGPDTTMCATTYLVEAGPAQLVVWNVNGSFSAGPDYNLVTTSGMPETFEVIADVTTAYCGNGSDTAVYILIPNASLDSATHICAEESATLQPGGGANATYLWSNGETTSSLVVSEPGSYSVVKTEEGCESSASIEITKSTAVNILDLEPCEDDAPITIDATIPDGNSYAWSGGTSMTTAVNTFDNSGVYSITTTDMHACVSTDSFNILFLGEPVAAITYIGTGGTAILFNSGNSQQLGSNATYLWTFNGADTSSAANPLYIFPWSATAVTYPVLLEIDNGCGVDQIQIMVSIDPLGVVEVEGTQSFTVFPNPAKDVVYLKSSQEWNNLEISIMDNAGRIIQTVNYNAAMEVIELNTSALASGSYIVKLSSDLSSEVHALIIQ